VSVAPGDLILADHDGVVVVPLGTARAAIEAAEQKARGENVVRAKLAEGMGVAEAFRRYGIL
jgi:regulator of RNase E activity RraA